MQIRRLAFICHDNNTPDEHPLVTLWQIHHHVAQQSPSSLHMVEPGTSIPSSHQIARHVSTGSPFTCTRSLVYLVPAPSPCNVPSVLDTARCQQCGYDHLQGFDSGGVCIGAGRPGDERLGGGFSRCQQRRVLVLLCFAGVHKERARQIGTEQIVPRACAKLQALVSAKEPCLSSSAAQSALADGTTKDGLT